MGLKDVSLKLGKALEVFEAWRVQNLIFGAKISLAAAWRTD